MKLKNRRILLSSLALGLMCQVPISASAAVQQTEPFSLVDNTDPEIETQAVVKVVRKIGVNSLFMIVNRLTGKIFSKPPTISLGASSDLASSGSIAFNTGNNGATVTKTIEAVKAGHQIEMWPATSQIGYTGKMAVYLSRPDSSVAPINKTVGHSQHSWFKVVKPGKHVARWTTTSKQSWNLWTAYFHWGDLNKFCDSKGNYAIPASEPGQQSEDSGIVEIAQNEDGKSISFETIGENRYIVPSLEHQQSNLNASNSDVKRKKVLSMNDLYYEYFDETLQEKVDIAKNYVAGDSVAVTDTVKNIEYNSEDNATIFEFATNYGPQYLAFKGNLTNKYDIGDSLGFRFNIVNLQQGSDYTNLDYSVVTQNGVFPDISEFLVSQLSKN